ncbi:MAG TPA: response regulator [Candidatus Acidoferrales bacterium]|nr:response regulator [Candidatus Acidoferrales bacterium]
MKKPTVLIVDDEMKYVSALTEFLRANGYRVHGVDDGAEVDQILTTKHIDVMILDLLMPGMNGWEVMRMLKDSLAPGHWQIDRGVKVIVTTGLPDQDVKGFALKLGADAYLVKPVDPKQILETLRTVLGNGLPSG